MSRPQIQPGRPSFAWQTNYSALAVEAGEESEEEVSTEAEVIESASAPSGPAKVTKTAQRKAAKAARVEKQRQRALAKGARGDATHPSDADSSRPETPLSAPDELPDLDVSDAPALLAQSPLAASVVNSDVIAPDVPAPRNPSLAAAPPIVPTPPPATPPAPIVAEAKIAPLPEVAAPVPIPQVQPIVEKAKEVISSVAPAVTKAAANLAASEDPAKAKKRQDMLERTLWTFIMIGGFLTLLLMGHAYMILLVMLCQTLVYREVTALFSLKSKDGAVAETTAKGRDPWSKTLNWYFFAVTNYFLYGESIIYYFKHVVFVDAHLTTLANKHRFISFMLYIIGFMGFVSSLKRGYLKQQFGLFCWVHMTLLLIVVSSHFIVNNILEGLIWFWVPASLVICNDVFAYIWGITIGRTPLIALSPKKTVEGFVGAFFSTVVFSLVWGTYFMRFDYMICPVRDLGVSAWTSVTCDPNPVFLWHSAQLPAALSVPLSTMLGRSVTSFPYLPYQFHLLVMSCFASLVAPFGGFFASGFKRAFHIKDFGHSIPGHGGMTDRMDCQFLMGVFTYVYYSSLIREHHVTVGSLLQTIVSGLTVDEQLQLIVDLKRYIEGQGISVPV